MRIKQKCDMIYTQYSYATHQIRHKEQKYSYLSYSFFAIDIFLSLCYNEFALVGRKPKVAGVSRATERRSKSAEIGVPRVHWL